MAELPQDPDQGVQTASKSTDLVLAKPTCKSLSTKSAEIGAQGLRLIRCTCRKITSSIRDKIETIIREGDKNDKNPERNKQTKGPVGYLRDATKRAVYKTVKFGRNAGRKLRWVDKVNVHAPPKLLDDHPADALLKSDIVADLESPIGIAAPFIEEIERIAKTCFDRGVPSERLISFLESKDVLELLMDEVLDGSHYRGSNIRAIVSSAMDALIHILENSVIKKGKKKVGRETEKDLMKKLEYFKAHYDPRDKKRTISNFIKELEKHFDQYDIITWIKENEAIFIEIIRGRAEEEYDENNPPPYETRHVANIVNEVYGARGKLEPEKYIELELGNFFLEYKCSDVDGIPAYVRKAIGAEVGKNKSIFVIDLDEVKSFFDNKLQGLQGPNSNLLQLRENLIKSCIQRINSVGDSQAVIIFVEKARLSKPYLRSDKNDFIETITQNITETCQFVSSHVDVRNLLFDPMGVPPEMMENYKDWYDEEGELDKSAYRRYLRGIFGHKTVKRDGDTKDEEFEKLRNRATTIFENINAYLASIPESLGIPPVTVPSVVEVNDYAELVKIVCTTKDPRERFAARRKIELAALMYTCMITPRYVYRDYEARATKDVLEHSRRGIDYVGYEQDKVYFIDKPGSQPREIPEENFAEIPEGSSVKEISLISIKFGGEIECHLLPTSDDDEFEYMSQKSLFSMLTNLLNEDNKRAKDMTDILRMTFVVESVEDLDALQKNIETNYISFGRSLKRENRYGKLVKVSSTSSVSENGAKSEEYRTLRYVVDIPVPDENDKIKVYAVPIEIRILLTEDLIKERSSNHSASHRKYEDRRLKQVLSRKIAPYEIFPEVYKQVGPDPDDIFETSSMVIKDSADYAMETTP